MREENIYAQVFIFPDGRKRVENGFQGILRLRMMELRAQTMERPEVAYFGREEKEAMEDIINRQTLLYDPRMQGKGNWFMGLRYFFVDEPTHLAVYAKLPDGQ